MPTDQPIDEEKEAHRRRSIRKRDAEDVPPRGGPDFRGFPRGLPLLPILKLLGPHPEPTSVCPLWDYLRTSENPRGDESDRQGRRVDRSHQSRLTNSRVSARVCGLERLTMPAQPVRPTHLERRSARRPRSGDTMRCPRCATGQLEFNERYRFDGVTTPGWVCDRASCGYRASARQDHPMGLIRAFKKVNAWARRVLMKAKSHDERAKSRVQRSLEHLALRKHTKRSPE
jgi:hypothetical protein